MADLPVSREDWAKTAIHKASAYSCGWCGRSLPGPHEFYEHLPDCEQAPAKVRDAARRHKDG